MEAAKIAQRVGTTLAHTLLAEARQPIGVVYESSEGVDLDYTLRSVFYIHMHNLKNLVNMSIDLWVAVSYMLREDGTQDIGFTVTHNKVEPCELKLYPLPSINYAAAVVKQFFSYSLLPYYDLAGEASSTDLTYLKSKYGNASSWGDTVTLNMRAEDFPYDVDFREGVFRGFSDRFWQLMKRDVQRALRNPSELNHRVFSRGNNLGVTFIPNETYLASKNVPGNL